jgi:class 3 adenylate cyclase
VTDLPTGVLTFLFTDMEGSTRLLAEIGRERYGHVLREHKRLLAETVARHGGRVVDDEGDGIFAAFGRARDAVVAAAEAQRVLEQHDWGEEGAPRIRIGLHTGEAELSGDAYVGLAVHRARRICEVAEGGQTMMSSTTRDLAEDDLPKEIVLRDAGERRLKDIRRPEQLSEVVPHTSGSGRRVRLEVEMEQSWPPPWLTARTLWIVLGLGIGFGVPLVALLAGAGIPGLVALVLLVALIPLVVRGLRR